VDAVTALHVDQMIPRDDDHEPSATELLPAIAIARGLSRSTSRPPASTISWSPASWASAGTRGR
jgi:hypothetical protein